MVLAEVSNLVRDLARANILLPLMDDRALTAKELAYEARVSPQTTSFHLSKLTDAKLLQVNKYGRNRDDRLASPLVGQMLETIMVVAGDRSPRLPPVSKLSEELRAARICYDHLAGRLGVAVGETLRTRRFLILEAEGAQLTRRGMSFFVELGVKVDTLPKSRRAFCWLMLRSERAPLSRGGSARRVFSWSLPGAADGSNAAKTAGRSKHQLRGGANSRTFFKSRMLCKRSNLVIAQISLKRPQIRGSFMKLFRFRGNFLTRFLGLFGRSEGGERGPGPGDGAVIHDSSGEADF